MTQVRSYDGIGIPESFWEKVEKDPDGCWIWTASCSPAGYGQLSVGPHKAVQAHRLAFTTLAEPLIPGLVLHHLCRQRRCVNPAHMIQLTRRSHILLEPQGGGAVNRSKTHCPKGHPYAGANLVRKASEEGRRRCRICTRKSGRESARRRRAQGTHV